MNNTGGTGTGANGKPSDSIVRPGGPVAAAVKPVALVGGARVIMGPSGGALGSGSSSKLGVNPNQVRRWPCDPIRSQLLLGDLGLIVAVFK